MDELKSPVLENKLRKKKKNKTSKNDLDLETGPVSFSQELNIGVDELESRIRSALSRIGQDPNNASLFSIIFPTEFHESDENALYHARTKMKELQEVVREMFKAIADVKKMILIIEEAQWCDSHSWNIIEEIFFGCPKVMIMIFTRSIKQYSGAGAEKVGFFRENKKTTHITLAGMSIDDAPDLILFYWDKNETKFLQTKPGELAKRKTVTSVNPDIVKNIHQRSNGNPLFVRSIVLSLFEADALKVDDWGQLNLNRSKIGPTFDLNKIIPDMDLQSIIVSQFDKLNSHFQQLLKVASVIGEEFFIEDAIYFLPKNLKYEFFDTQIAILDKYEFLRRESGDTVRYAFKSSMIRQSIYMMMHVEQRQQLHNDLAKHYESFLER